MTTAVRVAPLAPADDPAAHLGSRAAMGWLTAAEAAQYIRLPSTKALYQRVARGQIKPLRLGARQLRFRRRDLDALMRPA